MNIIVTGSMAFDQIMNFRDSFADYIMPDKMHVMSVSFSVDHLHKNFGGVGGNISYNLGLLGQQPVLMASVGKDAEDYKVYLEKNGVLTDSINFVEDDYTASFVVITDNKDCQIAGFYEGSLVHDSELSVKDAMQVHDLKPENSYLVVAPTYMDAMRKYVREAKELGIRYMYAPAQRIPQISAEDLLEGIDGADILVGNDYEHAMLEKKLGLTKEEILEKVNILITTLGDRGSVIEQKGKAEVVIGVAKPKEIKDPTGAGDAYIAGFLSGYLQGKPFYECGQRAATAAAYVVEKYGTTGHTFSLSLFENRLKENFQ